MKSDPLLSTSRDQMDEKYETAFARGRRLNFWLAQVVKLEEPWCSLATYQGGSKASCVCLCRYLIPFWERRAVAHSFWRSLTLMAMIRVRKIYTSNCHQTAFWCWSTKPSIFYKPHKVVYAL